tara:strand:- start:917 stop:1585 length:669 start_codon:yes stop_codon:yes gene_type:complete
MGGASAPPLCFLLLLNKKTFYKMGHIDELVVGDVIASNIDCNYVKFLTGDYFGLELNTYSDANADAGLTLTNNSFNEVAWDGGAGCAVTLPKAGLGNIVVFRFTGQADGGSNIVFTTASGDFYAAQTLNTDVTNIGDAAANSCRRVIGTDFTQTVATHAGAIVAITAAHNTFTIAATATNNQTNVGAELTFYCQKEGFWRLAFKGSELGSGALNATFEGSTV